VYGSENQRARLAAILISENTNGIERSRKEAEWRVPLHVCNSRIYPSVKVSERRRREGDH
jgi:hypothetical protein